MAFPALAFMHEDASVLRKETQTVESPPSFWSSYQGEEMSVTDLCHQYGISRPTAYKWIKRYEEVGPEGLLGLKPIGRDRKRDPRVTIPVLGSEEASSYQEYTASIVGLPGSPSMIWVDKTTSTFFAADEAIWTFAC